MEWLGLVPLAIAFGLLFWGFHREDRILNREAKRVTVTIKNGCGTYTIEGYSPEATVRIQKRLDEILKETK